MKDVPMRTLLRNDGDRPITVTLVTNDRPHQKMSLEKTLTKGDSLAYPEALADVVIVVIL